MMKKILCAQDNYRMQHLLIERPSLCAFDINI